MKFTWKVFLLGMLVTVLALSVASYVLTDAAFDAALRLETQKSLDRVNMLAAMVEKNAANLTFAADDTALADSLGSAATGEYASARLFASDRCALYPSSPLPALEDELFKQARSGISRRIERQDGAYRMQMLLPVQLGVRTGYLYLETDVSAPFALSDDMMRSAAALILAATAVAGAALLALARLLTGPVRELSAATRAFSGGDYSRRAGMKTSDEIGALARDFNAMADALQAHMDELSLQARRREEFVAGFAHELKTPLTSIIGYADTLRSRELSADERFFSANHIFTEGRRLERLSFKLLELMALNRQEFPLASLHTEHVRERLIFTLGRVLNEKYGVTLRCDLSDAVILSEADLLQTMLFNLCDNAAKASAGGQEVLVLGQGCPAGYRFDVCDRGSGISDEDLCRVTEAFYVADKSRARTRSGTGMGLALCDAIARALRTQMHIESEPDKGTRVWFLLPYGEETREEEEG